MNESDNLANNMCCPCFGVVCFLTAGPQRWRLWFQSLSRRGNNSEFLFFLLVWLQVFLPRDVLLAFFSRSCVGPFIEKKNKTLEERDDKAKCAIGWLDMCWRKFASNFRKILVVIKCYNIITLLHIFKWVGFFVRS